MIRGSLTVLASVDRDNVAGVLLGTHGSAVRTRSNRTIGGAAEEEGYD
jgi:hypothetical protein